MFVLFRKLTIFVPNLTQYSRIMKKKLLAIALLTLNPSLFSFVSAQTSALIHSKTQNELIGQEEFQSDEVVQEGFLTHYVNKAIEKQMLKEDTKREETQKADAAQPDNIAAGIEEPKKMKFGRHITDWVSAPKFGGYFIGRYQYTSQDGQNSGSGFTQRLTRFYLDGNIFKHLHYRIQLQASNDKFHMKDYFIEWKRYDFFQAKIGQYKRAFGLENPYNPWDVGMGDYSQLTKLFSGHADLISYEGSSNGGRDQGLQFQGDLFKIGKDQHHLLHYQVMVSNGQGINANDENPQKDVSGNIQIQPIKGLKFGFMGWTGRYQYKYSTSVMTNDPVTNVVTTTTTSHSERLRRDRWEVFASYDKHDWTFRGEYARHNGYTADLYKQYQSGLIGLDDVNDGVADAWYLTAGIPCTKWLKCYVKWDVYRSNADWNSAKTIYGICPNFQIHKNLMLQLQYNYVHDKTLAAGKRDYHQFWLETYVRF